MPQTNVMFGVDEEIKKEAEEIFLSMGLNLSSAINGFLAHAVQKKTLPFDVEIAQYISESEKKLFYESVESKMAQEEVEQRSYEKNRQYTSASELLRDCLFGEVDE